MKISEEKFRDHDFLCTKDGLFFCVVGPFHPVDRVIGYLKYIPDHMGRWGRDNKKFKRIMCVYNIPNLLEAMELLKIRHPQYLFYSQVYGITMSAVPLESIKIHFKPEEKATELFNAPILDTLQDKFVRLIHLLSEIASIPTECFGVTGSILLDIHNTSLSDMDITIYGTDNSFTLKKALANFSSDDLQMKPLQGERLKKWCLQKTRNHPISEAEAKKIYTRKWNLGMFEDTSFSLHPVKLDEELNEVYGDKTYKAGRMVSLIAKVIDSKDAMFLPSVYKIEDTIFEGYPNVDVREVVSYERLYDSLAKEGETIAVRGKLEYVHDRRTGENYNRILVGSLEGKGREYIKPLN